MKPTDFKKKAREWAKQHKTQYMRLASMEKEACTCKLHILCQRCYAVHMIRESLGALERWIR